MFGLVTRKELHRVVGDAVAPRPDVVRELQASRDQWRELALEALAEMREMRMRLLPAAGIEAEPGVDPKTTRDADAVRVRQLREQEEAA
jgi:hypothetical protein